MTDPTVSVQLDPALLADLNFVADWFETSHADIVAEAVRCWVADKKKAADAYIQEGIDSGERDGWIPHEEVMARFRRRAADGMATPAAAE